MAKRTDEPASPAQVPSLGSDYWSQSRRPLACLFFVGPLLLIYEVDLVCLGPSAMRNGADALLRQALDLLGFNAYFLLPVLTVGILLGWHHVLRQPWHVRPVVLLGMAFECLGLAAALWFSWRLYQFLYQEIEHNVAHTVGLSIAQPLGTISCYLGAGIYEELLFRLILLNVAIGLLAWMRAGRNASVIGGIALTSVIFSAAHYVGSSADDFLWRTFLFRFLAGVYFAVLFRYRGFGIAVGTHAFYDVLVVVSKMIAAG